MVVSESKGSVRLNEEAMKAWEKRIKEAQKAQQKRRRRASKNAGGTASASA
jgi:hypothetical protein